MRLTFIIATLLITGAVALADEGLQTNYYESAVNSGLDSTINYKKWTTSRDANVILVREERDLVRDGSWSQIDQIIMVNGKPVMHFLSFKGKRSVFYLPDAQVQVIHTDPDGDGLLNRLTLVENKRRIIDMFHADKTGRITPFSDEELAKSKDFLKEYTETMKNF